jgi:hypothetical protein
MLKQTILAIASLTTLAVAAVPLTTGAALAQRQPCTAGPYCDNNPGGGSTYECTEPLGHLRRVYEHELEEINNPRHVSIMPICIGEDNVFRTDGNAGALRQSIADNEAIMEALFRRNFGAEDVVGVRMIGPEKVLVIVHQFHNRY